MKRYAMLRSESNASHGWLAAWYYFLFMYILYSIIAQFSRCHSRVQVENVRDMQFLSSKKNIFSC